MTLRPVRRRGTLRPVRHGGTLQPVRRLRTRPSRPKAEVRERQPPGDGKRKGRRGRNTLHTTAVCAPATPDGAVRAATSPKTAPTEPAPRVAVPQSGDPTLTLLKRIGTVDPTSLNNYRAHGGYTALRHAFALGPAGVIREVTDAGLAGRGGAAFPTGRKWQATAAQPDHPHYLVCNADESEPGTFKDRVLMEGDPYALVEAMTIAAYATGAHRGYLYLRGEYPRALARLTHAIEQARTRGLLGDDVLGQGYAFDIEIRRGAGAYICGEETALFNSIEGHRGEPRSKPPFRPPSGRSEAKPDRFGPDAARVDEEPRVNDLYVRDYGKCILCYKCVDACGDQWQNSFAISVSGRGFDARISVEHDGPLTDSACVYCGNCIEVCPTGALSFKSEFDMRAAGTWDEERQTETTTVCAYCGVGCNLTLHVQDNEIVKVTSPHDNPVTHGNLCIKGRFGYQHVQNRD
ncbi:Ion-translocating oxidoreductase complex subunit C [Streptomyces tendae]